MMASSALYPCHVLSNQGSTSQISKWQLPRSHYKPLLSSSNEKSDISDSSKLQHAKPKKTLALSVLSSHWCNNNSSSLNKNTENSISMQHSTGSFSRKSEILVPGGSDSAPVKVLSKTVVCYVCRETVEEPNFNHHLFFGPVKCTVCSVTCTNCYSFKSVSDMIDCGCRHIFTYSDPCEFLLFQNSNFFLQGKTESEPNGKITVEKYVRILKTSCISDKLPWRRAIRALKNHKKSVSSSWSGVENTSESSQQSKTNRIVSSEVASTVTQGEKVDEHILSQSYDLEALDQATEYRYVELSSKAKHDMIQPFQLSKCMNKVASADKYNSIAVTAANTLPSLQKSESSKKIEDKRRQSDSSVNLSLDETKLSREAESRKKIEKRKQSDTESLVDIPSDGYYLVMTKAIEECPMCYTVICPSHFRINVMSFLVTTVCIGCGLTIYFAVSPNVSILTDHATVSINRRGRPPKKKGRGSKVPAEAVKAKTFFAK